MSLSRRKQSILNTGIGIFSSIMVIIVGLFLPISIIKVYGSEMNGLVSSLQQIISHFIVIEGGLSLGTI